MGMDRPGLILAALLALLSRAAFAAPAAAGRSVPVDSETVKVLGWNNDCSVAVERLGFAALGDAISGDPVVTQIGTLTIDPGAEKARADWQMDADGARTWSRADAAQAETNLREDGYVRFGRRETVRPLTLVPGDEFAALLVSTAAFQTRAKDFPEGYPGRWRLARVDYSPVLASCALLTFQDAPGKLFQLRLIRVPNVVARKDRARAHLGEAHRLLDEADRAGALAETTIAAEVCPEDPLSRYRHSLQLLLDGQTAPSLDELAAAVALDPSFKKRARNDKDFQDIAWMPRFQEITRR